MASEQYLGKSEDGLGVEEDPYEQMMTENNESHQKSLKNSNREQNQPPLLIDTEG